MVTGGRVAQWYRTGALFYWRLVLPFTCRFPLSKLLNSSEPLFPHLPNGLIKLQRLILAQYLNKSNIPEDATPKHLPSPTRSILSSPDFVGPPAFHHWSEASVASLTDFIASRSLPKALFDTELIISLCFLLSDLKIAFLANCLLAKVVTALR